MPAILTGADGAALVLLERKGGQVFGYIQANSRNYVLDSVSMVTEEHSLFLVRLNLRSSNFLSFAGTPKFMKD